MEWILLAVVIGVIPGAIASSKGHSFVGWWLYGAALFIVALPHSLMLKPDQRSLDQKAVASGDMRKCPSCAEMVRREAKVCRYCNRDLPEPAAALSPDLTG